MNLHNPEGRAQLQKLILRLASSPTGMKAQDLGVCESSAFAHLRKLEAAGQLCKIRSGKGTPARYFTSEKVRANFVNQSHVAAESQRTAAKHKGSRAWWPKDAKMNVTADTIYTFAPTHPPRYTASSVSVPQSTRVLRP